MSTPQRLSRNYTLNDNTSQAYALFTELLNCSLLFNNNFFVANGVVKAGEALDDIKEKANLRSPHLIYCTNLRKHCATIAQVNVHCSANKKCVVYIQNSI